MVSSALNKYFLYTLPWLTLTYHLVLLLIPPPLRIFCGSLILSYSQWQLSVSITSLLCQQHLTSSDVCLFNYLTFHFVALLPSLGLSTTTVGSLSAVVTDTAFSLEQGLVTLCAISKYALGKEGNKDYSNHCWHARNHTQLLSKWQWPKEFGGLLSVSPTLSCRLIPLGLTYCLLGSGSGHAVCFCKWQEKVDLN